MAHGVPLMPSKKAVVFYGEPEPQSLGKRLRSIVGVESALLRQWPPKRLSYLNCCGGAKSSYGPYRTFGV